MADIPDLIIRTSEERQEDESFPWGLVEGRLASGRVRIWTVDDPYPVPGDEYIEFKSWRFKTEIAMLVFAADRIRDMRKEGEPDIGAAYSRIYTEFPDRRLSPDSYDNPKCRRVRAEPNIPLVW